MTYTKLLFQDRKKLHKTGETKEEKKTSSFLSNYSLYVRDMLLVRPQKKSSKTVSCNIAVQKNLEQGSGGILFRSIYHNHIYRYVPQKVFQNWNIFQYNNVEIVFALI